MNYRRVCGCIVGRSVALRGWMATGVKGVKITQNRVTAGIELSGDVKADLELRFEQVLGLNVQSLGLSAKLIDPTNLSLAARLPASASIPVAFPVMISIEPPATGPLAFSGIV